MSIIIPANTLAAAGGYEVENSCRFDDGSSAYMHRTPNAGNRRTMTLSVWLKGSSLADGSNNVLGQYNSSNANNAMLLVIEGSGKIMVWNYTNTYTVDIRSNRFLRDNSAWYHIVVAVDTTQGTAANRVKIYVNGVQETALHNGSNAGATYPSQNLELFMNQNVAQNIGTQRYGSTVGSPWDGYMAEFCFIEGTQYAASDFGEFDNSGIWKPIDVSDLTFGTNGYYLDFQDSSALGNDVSGNDNDFTTVNLAAIDQSTDTCTNNFATLNPLHSIGAISELSQGNLEYDPAGHHRIISTIAPSSGKWYAEVKGIDSPDKFMAGVSYYPMPANGSASTFAFGQGVNGDVGRWANDFGVKANGQYGNNNSWSNYMSQPGNNDIIGIYLDLDNYKLYLSLNGTLGSATGKDLTNNGEPYGFISVGEAGTFQWNFGNPSFALANTAITDDNGFGAFEYSPNITGDSAAKKFYALCTKNLSEYG